MIYGCPGCSEPVDTSEAATFGPLVVCPECTHMFALR